MHIDSQPALLSLFFCGVVVVALLVAVGYLTMQLRFLKQRLKLWQTALQALGLDIYVFNNAVAQAQYVGKPNSQLLEELQNIDGLQAPLCNLLERGKSFEARVLMHNTPPMPPHMPPHMPQDVPHRVRGTIKDGRAFVLCEELTYMRQDNFAVLNDLPLLCYIIDDAGQLVYANNAFRKAMQEEPRPIFSAQQIDEGQTLVALNGERLHLSLHRLALDKTHSLITAIDISKQIELVAQIKELAQSYNQMLDSLPSGVAIFNKQQQLVFYNQAFVQIFNFELAFLESNPHHGAVLEYLRERGQVPTELDGQNWQADLFSAYKSLDIKHYRWYPANGKKLQIIAHPHSQGQVSWIYIDLTSQLELQARYDGLIKRQGATLDNLLEGVALFNEQGEIVLSNHAFTKLWAIDPQYGMQGLHINDLSPSYTKALTKEAVFSLPRLITALTTVAEKRTVKRGQLDLKNGDILEYSICPLPMGQNMLRFVDVTAKMRIARALSDKNDALLMLDKLRNEFVQYMGYELRTPLTSIIGFTQLIRLGETSGLLPSAQKYLEDVEIEAVKLQTSLDDTIDLVNLNAGIIKLEREELDIAKLCYAAQDKAAPRMQANNLGFILEMPALEYRFYGDAKRIIQLLSGMLRYISLYAPEGEQVKLIPSVHHTPLPAPPHAAMPAMTQPTVPGTTHATMWFSFHTLGTLNSGAEDAAPPRRIDLSLVKSLTRLLKGKLIFNRTSTHNVMVAQLPLEKIPIGDVDSLATKPGPNPGP